MEHALPRRTWSLCMTSENHGTVGPAGCKFTHAPDKHERVLVVEVPAASGAGSTVRPDWLEYDPADHILTFYGVKYSGDLFSGLGLGPVGMSFTILAREDGALTLCRGPVAAQAGPTVLTDERIEQIWDETVTADAETLKEVRMRFARAVARDIAAQAGQVPDWTSVDERLPNGCYCLATYRDRAGKLRIIRAMYVRQFEIEATGDECDSETDEANDREFLKAGWYELIDNWGDYSSVHVCEGPVTHWMALPALPGAEASTSGERQEGGAA